MATTKNSNRSSVSSRPKNSAGRVMATPASREKANAISPLSPSAHKLLSFISGARNTVAPEWPESWPDLKQLRVIDIAGYGNRFTYGAIQANVDFATLAHCELEQVIYFGGPEPNGFDLLTAPMYWQLRNCFVEEAASGDPYAFARAIWRTYHAGRLSPARILPPDLKPFRLDT
jgi:hypothetical protein